MRGEDRPRERRMVARMEGEALAAMLMAELVDAGFLIRIAQRDQEPDFRAVVERLFLLTPDEMRAVRGRLMRAIDATRGARIRRPARCETAATRSWRSASMR
jgi:hypothetical protein